MNTVLAITPGDPDGIGPEIVWKAIRSGRYRDRGVHLLCVGARKPFDEIGAPVFEASEEVLIKTRGALEYPPPSLGPVVWLIPAPVEKPKALNGKRVTHLQGFQSGWSIAKATSLVQKGIAAALVTGPISKERLQRGGFPYPGHTEFLAKLCKVRAHHVTMMLANDSLRVSLVTTHLALKDVPRALKRERIRRTIIDTVTHLQNWWGLDHPRVAVLALNPHAGESGIFGNEEIRIITPEIKALQKSSHGKYALSGPHPADTLFAKHAAGDRYDAVVCMYHDQGLIPVKLLDFPKTVNVTLGLPIIRTSVDHGVSFDIARTGKADSSSFQSAIEMALRIAQIAALKSNSRSDPNEKTERNAHGSRDQTIHLS